MWEITKSVLGVLLVLSPFWLPALLAYLFYSIWISYIHLKNVRDVDPILLEVKLPKDIRKSPEAMELALTAFWHVDPANNFIKKYWDGKIVPWFSLELVSIGGNVHFFIWTDKKNKNVIESRIYAQYPNVEVVEVPDYTEFVHFDPDTMKAFATEHALRKPDPYPIKTYVDYGLHENPKEEEKVDPLTSFIEFLGSVGPDDQVWHQIIVRAHQKKKKKGKWFEKGDWKDEAKDLVKKLKKEYEPEGGGDDKKEFSFFSLTEEQKKTISSIERSVTKQAFDVGIRSIYFAPKDSFSPTNIGGMMGSFYQVNSEDLNGFKPNNVAGFKYPWQDYKDKRKNSWLKAHFKNYKERSYFYPPYIAKPFVLNTEELATIYHFPGDVAQTPTFGRIGSRKSEPPTNLPV